MLTKFATTWGCGSLAAVIFSGCLEAALDRWDALTASEVSTGSTSSSSTGEPTTSSASGVQTVTGLPEATTGAATTSVDSGASTDAPAENPPPTVMLSAAPDVLSEAGKAMLLLDASADVVSVRLTMNDSEPVELTPADFPYTYEALSAKDNGTPHIFTVEVEDDEGLTAKDSAELTVQLPPSGAEKCLFVDDAAGGGMIAAAVYTEAAIVAAGWRDTGAGPKAALWKLDPDHCEPLPGWPKTIGNWSGDPNLASLASTLAAVAVDELGNIAASGNLVAGGKPQRYTALLTQDGSRLWERTGAPGEVVSSVVIAEDVVIAGGWKITSEDPLRTDAVFWRHMPDQTVWKTVMAAPFTVDEQPDPTNWLSEKIRAMLIEPETGFLVVLGERDFKPNQFDTFTRAFLARFAPLGGAIGSPATSPGDVLKEEAMNSIAVCRGELVAGGWTRDPSDPKLLRQPLFRWAAEGAWLEKKLPEFMSSTELRGAACDREGKTIGAGFRSTGGSDARVFAFTDPLGPRTWYETGVAGDDAANGLFCDTRGFCAWVGFRTANGKPSAVVRVHHP